jgi:hypothetical protein
VTAGDLPALHTAERLGALPRWLEERLSPAYPWLLFDDSTYIAVNQDEDFRAFMAHIQVRVCLALMIGWGIRLLYDCSMHS